MVTLSSLLDDLMGTSAELDAELRRHAMKEGC